MSTKKTYAEKLKDPRWQRKRLEVLQRDHFCCVMCDDAETELHVHHLEYGANPWDTPSNRLMTLCKHCHLEVEKFGKNLDLCDAVITKISGWESGIRIMISSKNELCIMRIYNGDDDLVVEIGLDPATMSEMIRSFQFPLQIIHKKYGSENFDLTHS